MSIYVPKYLNVRMTAFGNAFLAGQRFAEPSYFTKLPSIAFFDGNDIVARSPLEWWDYLAKAKAERLGFQGGIVVQSSDGLAFWKNRRHDSQIRASLSQAYSREWPGMEEISLASLTRSTPVYGPSSGLELAMPISDLGEIRRITSDFRSLLDEMLEAAKGDSQWRNIYRELQEHLDSGSPQMGKNDLSDFEGCESGGKEREINQYLPNFGYSLEAHRLLKAALTAASTCIEGHGYVGWQHSAWAEPFKDRYVSIFQEAIIAAVNSFRREA